jgi:hypothetical protein
MTHFSWPLVASLFRAKDMYFFLDFVGGRFCWLSVWFMFCRFNIARHSYLFTFLTHCYTTQCMASRRYRIAPLGLRAKLLRLATQSWFVGSENIIGAQQLLLVCQCSHRLWYGLEVGATRAGSRSCCFLCPHSLLYLGYVVLFCT